MATYADARVPLEFLDSELNLCHMLLDIAGPKPTANVLVKLRQEYETVCTCFGTVREASALAALTSKLTRLQKRLLPFLTPDSHSKQS